MNLLQSVLALLAVLAFLAASIAAERIAPPAPAVVLASAGVRAAQ